jgi:hypothetical protein
LKDTPITLKYNSALLQLSKKKRPKAPRAIPWEKNSIRRKKTYFYNRIVGLSG